MIDKKVFDKNRKYFGAIDLGSHNCRLLIAEKNGSNLKTIASISKMVGLGEGVARTSRLSKRAMDRAVIALSHCMKKVSQYNPIIFDAVTTEACRKAVNQTNFLKRIKRELGVDLRVISYEEEACYVLLGCRQWIHPETKYAFIFDIGGGSTELLWASLDNGLLGKFLDCVSIPYGVVSLSETFKQDLSSNYASTCFAVQNIAQDFCSKNHIEEIAGTSKVQMIGTSGTTTTVAAMRQNLRFYNREKVEGTILSFEDVQAVIKQLQLMRPEARLIHQCLGSNKEDLVLGGMAILEGIYRACPELMLTVTDRGVRDGLVSELVELEAKKVVSL